MTNTESHPAVSLPTFRSRRPAARAVLRRAFCTVGLLLVLLLTGPFQGRVVLAQDVIDRYQSARIEERAEELLEVLGRRIVPMDPVLLPTSADTIRWLDQGAQTAPRTQRTAGRAPELGSLTWRKITPAERHWFKRQFSGVEWTSQGMRSPSVVDTVSTRVIRAKLEEAYGPPSNTIVDIMRDREPRGAEYIQFEYWFIINGEIPFIVLDVAGPFEEGLVFAGDLAYQDILTEAKRSLVEQIMQTGRNASYVDYYYSFDREQWFVTGYTGDRYFVKQIERPPVSGGRPELEEIEVPSRAASAADSE